MTEHALTEETPLPHQKKAPPHRFFGRSERNDLVASLC